ncbi:SH3 domain-containing protein [Pseudoalteromonas xiamenensis]
MDSKTSKVEALNRALESQAKLIPSTASMMSSHSIANLYTDPFSDSFLSKNYQDLLQSLADHSARITSLTGHKELITSLIENRIQINSLYNQSSLFAELSKPTELFRKALANLEPQHISRDLVELVSPTLNSIRSMTVSAIEPHVENDVVSKESITKVSGEVITNAANSNAGDIKDLIIRLESEIRAVKEDATRQSVATNVYTLILFLLAPYFADLYSVHIKPHFLKAPNYSKRISHVRYVSASALNVRDAATVKSRVIGQLHFGDVVTVIKKEKNWCLIELKDNDSGTKISGWVFTRYLKTLK